MVTLGKGATEKKRRLLTFHDPYGTSSRRVPSTNVRAPTNVELVRQVNQVWAFWKAGEVGLFIFQKESFYGT